MKTVICEKNNIGLISDSNGKVLFKEIIKTPEKGKEYRVTGEYWLNGLLYYFIMGFGIKTVFRSDKFLDIK